MSKAIAHRKEPEQLALSAPLPLTQHPAAVYLSQLAPKSRRTMRQSLNAISSMLTQILHQFQEGVAKLLKI